MISTYAQCTATIEDVLSKVDKVIAQVGSDPPKQNAKRFLQQVLKTLLKKNKPSAEEKRNLVTACNCIRGVPLQMPELHTQLYDIEDFVDTL